MQHEKIKTAVSTQITAGDRTFSVKLVELAHFLEKIDTRLNIATVDDLELNLQIITDLVIDGTDDNLNAGELKNPLILLRELTMLFTSMLWDVTPNPVN